jgi:hypothetical protein
MALTSDYVASLLLLYKGHMSTAELSLSEREREPGTEKRAT